MNIADLGKIIKDTGAATVNAINALKASFDSAAKDLSTKADGAAAEAASMVGLLGDIDGKLDKLTADTQGPEAREGKPAAVNVVEHVG